MTFAISGQSGDQLDGLVEVRTVSSGLQFCHTIGHSRMPDRTRIRLEARIVSTDKPVPQRPNLRWPSTQTVGQLQTHFESKKDN